MDHCEAKNVYLHWDEFFIYITLKKRILSTKTLNIVVQIQMNTQL